MFNHKIENTNRLDYLLDDVLYIIYFYLSLEELSSLAFVSKKHNQNLCSPSFWGTKIKREFQTEPQEKKHPALYYKQLAKEKFELDYVIANEIMGELYQFIENNERQAQYY